MSIYVNGTKNLPTDEYTKLLLHCDGSNGSTTFVDETGKTVTRNGNATISTAQSKFGGASAIFDGSGDYLSFGSNADFSPGTGAFTVDFWVYLNARTAYGTPFDMRSADSNDVNSFAVGISWANTAGRPYMYGAGQSNVYFAENILSLNTWYHLAFVGNGGEDGSRNIKAYVNGTLGGTLTGNYNLNKNTLKIGSNFNGSSGYVNGYIDEFRFSKGIQRWTSNFTPPSSAYVWSASTPTNANYEVTSVTRSFSGVNREIKQIDRSYSGVNRLVFGTADSSVYLYNMGDECVALTGGWSTQADAYSTITKNISDFAFTRGWVGSSVGEAWFYSTNSIDLTAFNSITIDAEITGLFSSGGVYKFGLGIGTTQKGYDTLNQVISNAVKTRQDFTYDISAITGMKYISMMVYGATAIGYSIKLI